MSRFMKALAKVGLVELEEHELPAPAPAAEDTSMSSEEIARLLQGSGVGASAAPSSPSAPASPPAPQPPPPPPAPAALPLPSGPDGRPIIEEGRAFDAIYAQASLPHAPFPAEKLLKVIDGLRALDPVTRRAAIQAMDAADDSWAVEGVVQDARAKIGALEGAQLGLQQALAAAEAAGQADLEARTAWQQEASARIQAQIAELQALLEQELTAAAREKAEIQARLVSVREAAAREGLRLQREAQRLSELPQSFSA